MTLKFSAKTHRYWLDGQGVQGVTTILKEGIPKPALTYWAAKQVAEFVADNEEKVATLREMGRAPFVAALKDTPWETRDQAANRGTEIHSLAERLVHGEDVEVPELLVPYVQGFAKLIEAFDIRPILTEVSVGNRKEWYAGRLDLIATMRGTDETWLLDNKSSKGIYGETALQTAAYSKAEFYVKDGFEDTEIPMPRIDRIGVIHITEGGSTLHPLGHIEEAFKIFRHVKFVASKKDWLDGVIGTAMNSEVTA